MANLKLVTSNELIEELQSRGYIRVLWQESDIHYVISQFEETVEVTDKQIKGIIDYIEGKHDANIGLCWETLEMYIRDFLKI